MPNLEEWWNLPAFAPFFQGQKQNGKSGQYGYTGAGADTAIQPNRRVPGAGNGTYDAHEGEFVFDANATQAIGPDVLEAIRSGAKSGQVDPNTLRQAVGQPQKPGMRVGGFTGMSGMSSGIGSAVDKAREPITSGMKSAVGAANAIPPLPTTINISGMTPPPTKAPTALAGPAVQEPPLAINTSNIAPRPTSAPSAVATGVNAEAGAAKYGQFGNQTGTWTQEEIDARTKPAPEPEPDIRNEAIDYMRGIMKGDNAEVENMYNRYLQDIGGAGAAQTAAAKSEMARAGLGKEAIATGLSSLRRDISSNVSKAAGEMAGKSLEQATAAAKDLEAAGMWDKEWGAGESARMINDAQAMTFPEWQKKHPGATQEDYNRSARMGDVAYQQSALGLDSGQFSAISKLIDANSPFDVVNAKFKEYTGRDMTQAEYDQMQTATPFGATIFGREKGIADQLITQGGPENIAQAGKIYADLYPGVGIDWSTVITADNSARFSTAMGDLGKIVATAGNDIEEAMSLVEASGLGSTFRQLGIDTGKLTKLYQGLTVNKVDEEWKAIESSDAYKTLIGTDPEFAAELKTLWAKNKLGVEEMTIFDKYNIVDSKGNILASVAGEDAANEKATELGGTAVKTGKKTMVLTDNETGSTYGGSVSVPKGSKQGDVWIDNGIAYEFDSELGATPTTFAEPFDRVADKLYELGPTIDGKKNPYYDDIINARAAAYVSGNVRLNPGDLSADDPVYKRISNDSSITRGIGSTSIDKGGRQTEEHHYFTTFQPSEGAAEIAQGTLLNIDGKLYSYAGSEENDMSGDAWNAKTYYLVDMATGEKCLVQASEKEAADGSATGKNAKGDEIKMTVKKPIPVSGSGKSEEVDKEGVAFSTAGTASGLGSFLR